MPPAKIELEDGVEVLNVPSYQQPPGSHECMLYAIQMCLQYVSERHPSSEFRERVEVLSIEEIKEFVPTDNVGWRPDRGDIDELSEETEPVIFDYKYMIPSSYGKPQLTELIYDSLKHSMPVILILDPGAFREHYTALAEHAVVATGLTDNHVIYNDPWGDKHTRETRQDIFEAWRAANPSSVVEVKTDMETGDTTQERLFDEGELEP